MIYKIMGSKFLPLYLLIAAFVAFGAISASRVSAISSESVLVDITPGSPAPYEDVSITLHSYVDNLDSVLTTWSLNGRNVLSGIGKKTLLLKAPAAGSETAVNVVVSLPSGEAETRIIIRPLVMVLLFQANDAYVPPFYRGKALPTLDSEIKVVAMPEVRTASGLVDPKNMTYSWRRDYINLPEDSGYGRNFFTYTSDYLENSNNVSVTASTTDGKYSSEASIDIVAREPKILFYKNDESVGTIWEKVLADSHKIQGSIVVEAAPYFISPKEIQNPRLLWSWSINDNPVEVSSWKKNLMPLRAESGVSGTSRLRLIIENMDRISQTTSQEINIEF